MNRQNSNQEGQEMSPIEKQAADFEAILAVGGMPSRLPVQTEEPAGLLQDEACVCDALHDLLAEYGMNVEDFHAAADHDPDGLAAWVTGNIGTIM